MECDDKGGVMLGLGIVRQKRGEYQEATPILAETLAFYKRKFQGGDHSLIAKTLMSYARNFELCREYAEAEQHFREAVRLFTVTSGRECPLTATALASLAGVLTLRGSDAQIEEARELFSEALLYEASADVLNMNTVFELVMKMLQLGGSEGAQAKIDPARYIPIVPGIRKTFQRLTTTNKAIANDDTAAAFYKTAAEATLLAGEYELTQALLEAALRVLPTIKNFDVSGLIGMCKQMLTFVLLRRAGDVGSPSSS